jgi:hypothetical protein
MHQPIRSLTATALCLIGSLVPIDRPVSAATPLVGYTYVVRGLANTSNLESFATAAAATYADSRGWNLGGSIGFRRVSSGGDFTLWLAAARTVPGFGPPCDSTYSCTSGRNVIINETRWLAGSPSWNASGASLADYRRMVVNHETGHWLGFHHEFCGGAGQPAPVMQQQSISLQGCRPNPWPTAAERQRLAGSRGVPIRTGNPVGSLDAVVPRLASLYIRGWAIDPDTSAASRVTVRLDATAFTVPADSTRDDVGRSHPGFGSAHGFAITRNVTPGRHTVCVQALNAAGAGVPVSLGCRTVLVSGTPIGRLDSAVPVGLGILASGWAIDPDTRGPTPVAVYEYPGGQVGVWADQARPDVAARYPRWGAGHGFAVLLRAAPGTHRVCAFAVNRYGIGSTGNLGCRTVQVGG